MKNKIAPQLRAGCLRGFVNGYAIISYSGIENNHNKLIKTLN
jgi:hypothetical protein